MQFELSREQDFVRKMVREFEKDITMKRSEYEALMVKMLGEEIGYGNLMCWASALWRKSLADEGLPISGAFVPRIDTKQIGGDPYDAEVCRIFGKTKNKGE